MYKRILVSGALGGVVLLACTFMANVMFGLMPRIEMNRVSDEPALYRHLKASVPAPGAYLVNPEVTAEGRFPDNEPVFSVRYGGMGHEAAGTLFLTETTQLFASAILAAGLLAFASPRVLSRYTRRVLFIATLGLLFALVGDLPRIGIGGYPPDSGLWLAAHRLTSWILVGLVMAWPMRVRETAHQRKENEHGMDGIRK
jgi:hypothetical protein